MRVLVDIVHPADVLFFLRPIRRFLARGDAVLIASRRKDVACELLDRFGLEHEPLTTAGSGLAGLAGELVRRGVAIAARARAFRPEVMLGFGGVAASHAGRVLGVPSVVFYDSENARLQTRLAWPFVTHLTVPEDYAGPTPAGRTSRLKGTKDLSYFHPAAFAPDRERALRAGLDPSRKNIFVRLVSWRANHDIGKTGWDGALAERLVATLGADCALHVSAEADAPPAFKPFLWAGDPADAHHLMAHCDLVAGESATMACEAVALGAPAIYAGVDTPGYVRGLERRGLLKILPPTERTRLPEACANLLADRRAFDAARTAWLDQCPDWCDAVVAAADAHARDPW